MFKRLMMAAALVTCAVPVSANERPPPPDPTEDPLMMSAGFLSWHPDLRYRLMGLEAMQEEELDDAFRYFQRASFYADKPSQGMVAEMLWTAQGVEQDRALGYAWMDLAAERGYRGFVILRERYWNELTAAERERAVELGQEVYARYGDAAAQPRLARQLRRGRRETTGSRTGFTGTLQIVVPGPGGAQTIDGSKFYDERFWDPEQYMAWHDQIWMEPKVGRVDVGELETLRDQPPGKSRIPETAPQVDAEEPPVPEETPVPR